MPESFRSPFSLGLICGLMASACFSIGGVYACRSDASPSAMDAAISPAAVLLPGLLLSLPGALALGFRRALVRWLCSGVAMALALAVPPSLAMIHWSGGPPPPWSPFVRGGTTYFYTVGFAVLIVLSLCRARHDDFDDNLAATIACVGGLILITLASRHVLPKRPFVMLQYWEGAVIALGGPWLGIAMWNTPSFISSGEKR